MVTQNDSNHLPACLFEDFMTINFIVES